MRYRWLLTLLLLLPLYGAAQRPPLFVPNDPSTVLERLPSGYGAIAAPSREAASMADMERLLALAARLGDARLAARAASLLARFPASDRSPQVLRLRAFEAQHRHDFDTALAHLDALVRTAPRDSGARLDRIQIRLLRGDIAIARGECASLAIAVDARQGLLCIAAIALRTGQSASAAAALDRWLGQAGIEPASLRHALVMRGEIATQAGDERADEWFRRALTLAPDDVRTLSAYSRSLRARGRHQDVLRLLDPGTATDSLRLERALAARMTDRSDAEHLRADLARRFAQAHAIGVTPERRDEAEFRLSLEGDAPAALALALQNFAEQRDHEDVELLQRAALAARQPEALDGMLSWAKAQGLAVATPASAVAAAAAP